jgi:predicted component of type VI protein secretion system
MLQLTLVEESMAGTEMVARHFPFRLGRSSGMDWTIERPGVWEEHAELRVDGAVVQVAAIGAAAVRVNGRTIPGPTPLRSGDLLELGSVKVRVALVAATQKKIPRQKLVLAGLILTITALEVVIYGWLVGQ